MKTTVKLTESMRSELKELCGALTLTEAVALRVDKFETIAGIQKHDIPEGVKASSILVSLPINHWAKLNYWIIEQTTEETHYNMRDALLTLMRMVK